MSAPLPTFRPEAVERVRADQASSKDRPVILTTPIWIAIFGLMLVLAASGLWIYRAMGGL